MTAPNPQPGYTIVVGVSATTKSPSALRWAMEEARLRNGTVVAVRAWRPPLPPPATGSPGTPPAVTVDIRSAEAAAADRLRNDVTEILGQGHRVETRLVRGGRRKTLIDESLGADLLVIDAPGVGDLAASPLSVQRLVRQAGCPVVVTPGRAGHHDGGFGRTTSKAVRSISDAAGRAGRPGIRPAPPS